MVLIKTATPTRHFNSFYQESALLVQLMLNEVSEICSLTCFLKSFSQSSPVTIHLKSWIEPLLQCLLKITGGEQLGKSFYDHLQGPLSRLKSYCSHLQLVNLSKKSAFFHLAQKVNQMDLQIQKIFYFFYSIETIPNKNKQRLYIHRFQKIVCSLLLSIEHSSKIFLHCLKQFSNNENVLFFLLRKKSLLAKIYNEQTIALLLRSLSKKHSLATLLINNFQSRGFDHLLPTIKRELFFHESTQLTTD